MAAAANATRCCSPPESWDGRERGPVGPADDIEQLGRPAAVDAAEPGGQLDLLDGA